MTAFGLAFTCPTVVYAAVAEGPVSSNAADSDAADLGASAEELEVEDPGLRDLAMCLTEHALQHESAGPDGQARAVGSEQVVGSEQSRGGNATAAAAAAVKLEAVEAGNEAAVMQPVVADAGNEMQLLEVSGRHFSLCTCVSRLGMAHELCCSSVHTPVFIQCFVEALTLACVIHSMH